MATIIWVVLLLQVYVVHTCIDKFISTTEIEDVITDFVGTVYDDASAMVIGLDIFGDKYVLLCDKNIRNIKGMNVYEVTGDDSAIYEAATYSQYIQYENGYLYVYNNSLIYKIEVQKQKLKLMSTSRCEEIMHVNHYSISLYDHCGGSMTKWVMYGCVGFMVMIVLLSSVTCYVYAKKLIYHRKRKPENIYLSEAKSLLEKTLITIQNAQEISENLTLDRKRQNGIEKFAKTRVGPYPTTIQSTPAIPLCTKNVEMGNY